MASSWAGTSVRSMAAKSVVTPAVSSSSCWEERSVQMSWAQRYTPGQLASMVALSSLLKAACQAVVSPARSWGTKSPARYSTMSAAATAVFRLPPALSASKAMQPFSATVSRRVFTAPRASVTACSGVALSGVAWVSVCAVAGAAVSGGVELVLCLWWTARHTGLRPPLFRWLAAPGLASLLAGLTANLLFRVLKDAGLAPVPAGLAALAFFLVLYLSALQAQGVEARAFLRALR